MAHWLLAPFSEPLTRRALAEVLVLALACGPLGAWILLYRQSYAAESISHGMLPGLVLAALGGAPLVAGAAGGVVVAAGAIALAGRDERLGGDAGVAVAVSALFGLGALLALSPAAPPRLQELLFGDLYWHRLRPCSPSDAAAYAAASFRILEVRQARTALRTALKTDRIDRFRSLAVLADPSQPLRRENFVDV